MNPELLTSKSAKLIIPQFFYDPTGDICKAKPISAIWIKETKRGFFRRLTFSVCLDYEDGTGWEWECENQGVAVIFRDELIESAIQSGSCQPKTWSEI